MNPKIRLLDCDLTPRQARLKKLKREYDIKRNAEKKADKLALEEYTDLEADIHPQYAIYPKEEKKGIFKLLKW